MEKNVTREELVRALDEKSAEFREINLKASNHVRSCVRETLQRAGVEDELFTDSKFYTGEHVMEKYNLIKFYVHDIQPNGRERMWYNFDLRIVVFFRCDGEPGIEICPSIGSFSNSWEDFAHRRIYVIFGRIVDDFEQLKMALANFDWKSWNDAMYAKQLADGKLQVFDHQVKMEKIDREFKEIEEKLHPGLEFNYTGSNTVWRIVKITPKLVTVENDRTWVRRIKKEEFLHNVRGNKVSIVK